MKPFGLAVAALSMAINVGAVVFYLRQLAALLGPAQVSANIVCIGAIFAWLLWIRPGWVKLTAFAYAERLLGAIEQLEQGDSAA